MHEFCALAKIKTLLSRRAHAVAYHCFAGNSGRPALSRPPLLSAKSRLEYLTPPRQEVARWRDRLQGHLWRRRRRPERLYIRAKSNYGNIEGKQISKQVGDRRSMFKKNKDSPPPAPLKNRRSDDALALAGRKNSAWPPHDLRRTGATMSRRRASRLI